MNAASVFLDFNNLRNSLLPFDRRHPPCEVVAVEGGVGVSADQSIFDFHPPTIVQDLGSGKESDSAEKLNGKISTNFDCSSVRPEALEG
jgi:hypothetical protein